MQRIHLRIPQSGIILVDVDFNPRLRKQNLLELRSCEVDVWICLALHDYLATNVAPYGGLLDHRFPMVTYGYKDYAATQHQKSQMFLDPGRCPRLMI